MLPSLFTKEFGIHMSQDTLKAALKVCSGRTRRFKVCNGRLHIEKCSQPFRALVVGNELYLKFRPTPPPILNEHSLTSPSTSMVVENGPALSGHGSYMRPGGS